LSIPPTLRATQRITVSTQASKNCSIGIVHGMPSRSLSPASPRSSTVQSIAWNSQGVVIPKPVLAQLGLDAKAGVEMTIEDGALVLRRPASPSRTGWAEAARSIAEAGGDELVMGEFGNAGDSELAW
jgi:antitoxin MazE